MDEGRRKERGFTLIGILILVVIIGLLAALVGAKLFGKVSSIPSITP